MVNTSWFRFDLITFRKDFSVGTVFQYLCMQCRAKSSELSLSSPVIYLNESNSVRSILGNRNGTSPKSQNLLWVHTSQGSIHRPGELRVMEIINKQSIVTYFIFFNIIPELSKRNNIYTFVFFHLNSISSFYKRNIF